MAELIQEVRDGVHPEGVMLTASIFTDQCGMSSEEIAALVALIEGHQQDVDDGVLVWATLPDVVATWKTVYGGQAYIVNAPGESPDPPDPSCPEAGCPQGMVCCEPPAPCAGTCVEHCAKDPTQCPPDTVCLDTGLCGPE